MTDQTTPDRPSTLDLDEIRRRIPALYAGPWSVTQSDHGSWLIGYPTEHPDAGLVATVPDYGEQLAQFIAAAREDVPDLLAELELLRAELERITTAIERYADQLRTDAQATDDAIAVGLLRAADGLSDLIADHTAVSLGSPHRAQEPDARRRDFVPLSELNLRQDRP